MDVVLGSSELTHTGVTRCRILMEGTAADPREAVGSRCMFGQASERSKRPSHRGYEIRSTIFGKVNVHYTCPKCSERLQSPLSDVGTADSCPACGTRFVVPGADAKQSISRNEQAVREKRTQQLATPPPPTPSPGVTSPPAMRRSPNQVRHEAELSAHKQVRVDGDQHRDGNAALSEFMPNFDPDDWDEGLLDALRCIVEGVNRLREGPTSRTTRTTSPFPRKLDSDYLDAEVAELLSQVEHAIEQVRAAMKDGEPFPSSDFVFRFDESIIDDDLIAFVRRIQMVLNGLRKGRSRRAVNSQLTLFDLSETQTQDHTSPSKPAEVPSRQDESSWQSLVAEARDSGQHGKAVELAEQAVREYPRSAWLWQELGGELTKLERLDEAENALDTAHRLNPKAEWLWRHCAALRRKREDLEGEIESLETLNSLGVASWHDLILLGIAYHNHQDLDKAVECYRLSAAAENTSAAWFNLALAYSDPEFSQDADAADACRCALGVDPDHALARELLEKTKRKLAPLATQAMAGAEGLTKQDEFFDSYISPFELLQINNVTAAEAIDAKAIKKAKDRLNVELELNDGKVGWLGDYPLGRARAISVIDELDDDANRYYHVEIFRNKPLLNFLTRGEIQHFLYSDDYFPCDTEEVLHQEPGFHKFLSEPFARQYNRVLSRAIEQQRLAVVEVLLDGRRWVEPEDTDLCFEGACKRIENVVEAMRFKAAEGCSHKVSLREMQDFLRERSLPELFNLLPSHFARYQGDIVAEIRNLAISCFNQHGDPVLSKGVLRLCKNFTSRSVALTKQLEEDFRTVEAMISKYRQPALRTITKPEKSLMFRAGKLYRQLMTADLHPILTRTILVTALVTGLVVVVPAIVFLNLESAKRTRNTPTETARISRSNPPALSSRMPQNEAEAATWDLPPVALPANGTVTRYHYSEAIAPLTIATRAGGGHYYVKLRTVGTGKVIAAVFVREGQRASIEVPLGTYELSYATGRTWYGSEAGALFGPETRYAKADDTFTFRIDGNQIQGYTVELYLQTYGNLETEPMSAREF